MKDKLCIRNTAATQIYHHYSYVSKVKILINCHTKHLEKKWPANSGEVRLAFAIALGVWAGLVWKPMKV